MKFSVSAVLLFILVFPGSVEAQDLIYNNSVTGVCYAGPGTTKLYIPPPDKFFRKNTSEGGASIKVYYTGFSAEAKAAFEYAADILESILPDGTMTTVSARWERIETSGVLGNSSVTAVIGGWAIDALRPYALYPVALGEKIAGMSLNSDLGGDIVLSLNSSASWYTGTDGNVPPGKYDLVTVILHELCHGLGFFDSMNAEDNTGWYGFGSIPVVYDTFIENKEGKKLTDTLVFENYSAGLFNEYTGGNLFFKGPVLTAFTNQSRVRIYAPSTWDDGSSISHLDEEFSIDPESRLMTPFIDMQEAIHDPGSYTEAILGDMGWISTRIVHDPPGDTEKFLTSLELEIDIQSDTLYNHDKVGVVYSFDEFDTSDTLYMSSLLSDNHFEVSLADLSYNTDVQYYFFAEDIFGRVFRSPSLFQTFRYKTFIGTDTVKAIINHAPPGYLFEYEDSVKLSAVVTDNIAVDSVYIEYRLNDGQKYYARLNIDSIDIYSITGLPGISEWGDGDSLRYRIIAVDSANNPNFSFSPDSGTYNIPVVGFSDVQSSYSTDFSYAGDDFFLSGFEIKRLTGWQKTGLHTKHPYISPETDETINSIALLKIPVTLDKSGMIIQYSDVALVEPGETGALFGSEDFYDYVVVEGSRDLGKTWNSLFTGYDATYSSVWLNAYNGSITDQNSTAVAREDMLTEHIELVKPGNEFNAGDTLLIRFRLFSDPYANGWGWVIHDLKINPLINSVSERKVEDLILFPNPGNGMIQIQERNGAFIQPGRIPYKIYNSAGINVLDGFLDTGSEEFINISHLMPGLYIFVLYTDDGIRTFRYILMK